MSNTVLSNNETNIDFNPDSIIDQILQDTASKLKGNKIKKTKKIVQSSKKFSTQNTRTRIKSDNKINSKKNSSPQKQNKNQALKSTLFPQVSRENWKKFEQSLQNKDPVDEVNKKLQSCIARMHGYEVFDSHFTSLHYVRLAIVDSLMNRKWNNLMKLVVMLSRNYYDPAYKMLIRHLCQILKHYHPDIRGTQLEDEIDLIVEKYETKRATITNMNNTV